MPADRDGRGRFQTHGLSWEQRQEFMAGREMKCGICGCMLIQGTAHIDHCHETGKLRGLLCSTCNTRLGRLGDNWQGVVKRLAEDLAWAGKALGYLSEREEDPA